MPQTKASVRFTREEIILLALMAALQFSHIVDFMIMMPLGPQLMRLFDITPQSFGLLVSSYTLAAGISGFAASFFIDRYDRKSCLLFFYVGFAVGTLACAFAPTYAILLITRSITGVFGGVLGSLVLSIVSDAISYERRGTAMGIVMGSFSVASVLGVPFSLYLANLWGWHAPFVFLAAVSFLVILLVIAFVPKMRGHLNHGGAKILPMDSLKHIANTPNQQLALLFMFCLILGQFTIIPFLSPSFVANAGLREDQLPLIYLFGGLCSMVASPMTGRLSDRFGKKQVFVTAIVLSLIPIYMVTHLNVGPAWVTLTASCLFFIFMSGRMVPAMAMISSTATARYRGSFMSVSSAVQQLSAASASYVAGLIVVKGADGRLENYGYVGFISIGFSLIALLVATRLRQDEAHVAPKIDTSPGSGGEAGVGAIAEADLSTQTPSKK